MQRTPLAGFRSFVSQDPLDIEDDSRGGLESFSPELVLVLTAVTSVALVAGAVSAPIAVASLAASTGVVIAAGFSRTTAPTEGAKSQG
jgi:hypothetical protein